MNSLPRPSIQDLDEIHIHGSPLWPSLEGKRLFLSGGTGFFGRWLLESFYYEMEVYGLDLDVTVLSRNPDAFFERAPHFRQHRRIRFIEGDVTTFAFPSGTIDYVIHAATEVSNPLNNERPLLLADSIVQGTRRMLDFAVQARASRFLLTSSGAVYGKQPPELSHIPEDFAGSPNPCDPRNVYGEGKRMAELLCGIYHKQHHLNCQIARCFAFVGPYLPLDTHFAAGNFLRNTLRGERIIIQGDGTPFRSYMYGTDLVNWLLTILLVGRPMQPYHVGSDEAISIADLAKMISSLASPKPPVEILGVPHSGQLPERYVPDSKQTRSQLGLRLTVGLHEAFQRTWQFHQSTK